jgi:hypothetical protein
MSIWDQGAFSLMIFIFAVHYAKSSLLYAGM